MPEWEAATAHRAGITGHRALPNAGLVAAAVDTVLDELDAAWTPPRMIVSSLAEGADRLVARAALARKGWTLTVVLPLDRDDYATDFATDESQHEFAALLEAATDTEHLPPQPTREDAYFAAGLRMVAHSDVVLAVWDGEPARGRGGTGDIVAHVRAIGAPLAWVNSSNASITRERWPWAC